MIDRGQLPYPVDAYTVERAYMRAKAFQEDGRLHLAQQGMRAAKARDDKLLAVLSRASEIVTKMHEEQRGQTQRSARDSQRATVTAVSLICEAYRLADEGNPIDQFSWIYAAFGELAGVVM